jgi:basic membrane lipoprotein Med (substrate-binding protein (PBP1-ABC) superfamily)
LVGVVTLALAAACGGATGEVDPAAGGTENTEAMLVYGAFVGPLEAPWDGVVHRALQAEADAGNIRYKHVDSLGYAGGMERALRDIAQNEKPEVIFGDAFGNEAAVRNVAKDFPDIAFAFGSGEPQQAPNLSVFDNWIHDPAYLAGMLSGGVTKSNVLGVVGAYPVPEVNRIINAYVAGARAVNPDVTVKVTFINNFFDPAKAKQAAQAQISADADVLFAERAGVIEAANENGLPSIGSMYDQRREAPESVMTSLLWDMGPTVRAVIDQVRNGQYEATNLKDYSFLKNRGSSLAEINTGVRGGIPQDIVDTVMAKLEEIKSGAFTTPVDETPPAGSIELQN